MFNVQAPRAVALAAGFALLAAAAAAQTTRAPGAAPSQNADTWDGVRHAPGADLPGQEQAAGVALPPAQRHGQTDEVEQLQGQILRRAQQGTHDGIADGSAATQPAP